MSPFSLAWGGKGDILLFRNKAECPLFPSAHPGPLPEGEGERQSVLRSGPSSPLPIARPKRHRRQPPLSGPGGQSTHEPPQEKPCGDETARKISALPQLSRRKAKDFFLAKNQRGGATGGDASS